MAGLSRSALLGDSEADTGRSVKGIGNTLAVDKHQHNSMWRRLPQRWEKTEYTASGDKEGEGSGIMGHLQLKSLPKLPCKATTPCLLCVTVTGTCKQCYYYQVSCMELWETLSRCDQHNRISRKEWSIRAVLSWALMSFNFKWRSCELIIIPSASLTISANLLKIQQTVS